MYISDELKNDIIKLYNEGLTYDKISETLIVGKSTVWKTIKTYSELNNNKGGRPTRIFTEAEKRRIRNAYKENVTLRELQKIYHADRSKLKQIIDET